MGKRRVLETRPSLGADSRLPLTSQTVPRWPSEPGCPQLQCEEHSIYFITPREGLPVLSSQGEGQVQGCPDRAAAGRGVSLSCHEPGLVQGTGDQAGHAPAVGLAKEEPTGRGEGWDSQLHLTWG